MFNGIFVLEVILKVIAYGAFGRPTSYFRNYWNLFDFFLALVGLFEMSSGSLYKEHVRTLMSLRPMRLIKEI